MEIKKLSVIIPVYNEERTSQQLLEKVIAVKLNNNIEKELLIINDCSKDATENQVLQFIKQYPESNIQYSKHEKNAGKGAAIRTGIHKASGDCLIVQDADMEYDPREYNILLQPIIDGFADVVYGSRFMGDKPHRILFFWHSIGNKMLTTFSNMFTNLNLTDMETCYKLFKTDIIKNINLVENRFGFEPEVTAKVSKVPGIRIYEVGISYYGRTYAEGKKITMKDGFRAIFCIVKHNLFK